MERPASAAAVCISPSLADEGTFRALVERGSDLALICDPEMVITYAGPSLTRLFGFEPAEVVGRSGLVFVHPDDHDALLDLWHTVLPAAGAHSRVEVRSRRKDGQWRWVDVRVTNLLDDDAVRGMVVNVADVTERREAADALEAAQRFHQSILEAAQEGVWVVGREGRNVFTNDRLAELLGTTRAQLEAGSIADVLDEDAYRVVQSHLKLRPLGVRDSYEVEVRAHGGERRWLLISGNPLYDRAGEFIGSLGMCADISERKRLEQELARLSLYDSLTQLPNQALFFDRLKQLESESERTGADLAVLSCGLDRFKQINDVRGHHVGDEVLAAVAGRLQQVVREGDTVARLGGDEFVVLCPDTDAETAVKLARDACTAISEPFCIGGEQVRLSASIGVAATPGTPASELLRAADRARYRAKERGRARVEVHDGAADRLWPDFLRLAADLQQALDAEALEVHYQPIVRLTDAAPVGVEALLRWTHPQLGPVSPATFIPAAEEAGMMPRLGAWSLQRACAEAARGGQLGADTYLAVNLSTRQLADPAMVDVVRTTLQTTGFPAARLMLEVTETAVVTDGREARNALEALRDLGVRVAIDDFGTGYSSLSYLRQFPVDTIKIDRTFVAGMTDDADDLAIVASLISLAAAVGVDAVAEGVETEEQADVLRRLGCPLGQGFLWSQAVPAGRLADVLAAIARGQLRTAAPAAAGGRADIRAAHSLSPDESVASRIIALHHAGASLTTIAAALNAEGLTTSRGLRWHRSSVARVIAERQFPGVTAR